MASNVPARLTRRDGRRFGFTVGGAFFVFAALAWWRERLLIASVLSTFSGLLAVAALLMPTRLGPIERGWMKLAHAISLVTTPIVMAVMYFGIITPIGLTLRRFGHRAIEHRPGAHGFWKTRPAGKRRSASMEQQF
jgi:hypothetical protein